jgi:hypothetical protein
MSDGALAHLLLAALLWFFFPLWLLAGVADYFCHRSKAIERTSGVGESALHVLQAIEIAIPLVLGLFFEINALVLVIMVVAVLAHTLTALWDGAYTHARRDIPAFEQHIHSHLEYIPIVAVVIVALLNWDAVRTVFGAVNPIRPWVLQLKHQPLPRHVVVIVLGAVLLLQGSLLVEEFVRTWQQRQVNATVRAR